VKILLTRSPEQNELLYAAMGSTTAEIISLPLLQSEPLLLTEASKRSVLGLDLFDDIIFISRNAVRYSLDTLEQYWPQWPIGLRWFAVGPGTAEALACAQVTVIYPQTASSEGLLAMPELNNMVGRKCLIMRGEGGRETLRQGLEARDAVVQYLETYRRVPIPFAANALPGDEVVVALLYSGEAIAHLLDEGGAAVLSYRLIVPSERLQRMANALGFAKVELANSQEDHAMLHVLQQMQRQMP
jgi:uroporphyrinogen-III synthase